jgi:hypothetical protein
VECEVTQLTAEVRSVRFASEAALEALSRRTDAAEECLSGQAGEVTALRAFVESAQKESAILLERLSRGEADITRLAAEVAALRGHSEGAQKQLAAHEEKLSGFDRTEADIIALKGILLQPRLGLLDSLITPQLPPLFDEFNANRFNLLWRGSRDGFTTQEFHLHCDGRANTLTLISDTDGNIFGRFTPVKWESSAPRAVERLIPLTSANLSSIKRSLAPQKVPATKAKPPKSQPLSRRSTDATANRGCRCELPRLTPLKL